MQAIDEFWKREQVLCISLALFPGPHPAFKRLPGNEASLVYVYWGDGYSTALNYPVQAEKRGRVYPVQAEKRGRVYFRMGCISGTLRYHLYFVFTVIL